MTESEYNAALKRIEALADCANDEECKELKELSERVGLYEGPLYELGSGNVFEDLGLDNPEELLREARRGLE